MTVQALRQKVGDDTFFRIMRAWVTENRYGNVTTSQFIALAERTSGMDPARAPRPRTRIRHR
jgi:aminopeptidase N